MEWTVEERYRRIEDVSDEYMKSLTRLVNQCPFRQTFHIQPTTGLLNDPNGFVYFNGEYHLFYQWFPLGAVHGLKYWYHTKSKNLVDWENVGIGIHPDKYYESHGAFSGSGFVHEDKLYLMYTGNHRTEDWTRIPTQAIAMMDKKGSVEKLPHPVIDSVPTGYTDHYRDPKVWQVNGMFYAVIGAQRTNETGCVVVYRSKDLRNWEFQGEIKTEYPNFGYMWECPDYFELDGQGVLVLSPQGIEPEGYKYHNIHQAGYFIGKPLDLDTLQFTHEAFVSLDHGFDFYAPQTTEDEKGRRILVGWMGLPDVSTPTDTSGWAHCLTLPRELTIKDGQLYQKPVEELKKLRNEEESYAGKVTGVTQFSIGKHYELEARFSDMQADVVGINLRVGDGEKTVIKYDVKNELLTLDRTQSGLPTGEVYGTTRTIPYSSDRLKLQIFMDTSSVEIFVDEGKYVFTSRIFPTNEENGIEFFAEKGTCQVKSRKWNIVR